MKTQRWVLTDENRVRIYPDEIDGKIMPWSEYSLLALRQMSRALYHVMESKTPDANQQTEPRPVG